MFFAVLQIPKNPNITGNVSMSIYTRNCYTYLIGWSTLDTWYYGAKYGKDANPDTFWVDYFTSSRYVKNFRKLHGEPDVIQIRKTFKDNPLKCRKYEHTVLRRMCVDKNDRFLNKFIGSDKYYIEGVSTAKDLYGNNIGIVPLSDVRWSTGEIVNINKGREFSKEHKNNIKNSHHDCSGRNNSFFGKQHSEETKRKIANRKYQILGEHYNAKKVYIDGIIYSSVSCAAIHLSIQQNTLRDILKGRSNSASKYGITEYYYI